MRFTVKSQRGNALVGILAAAGIFGVLSAAMANLVADIWKARNSAKSLSEANNFHEEMRSHFSRPENCLLPDCPAGFNPTNMSINVPDETREGSTVHGYSFLICVKS
jgi:hypothetical protein